MDNQSMSDQQMPEKHTAKRQRVTEDILPSYSFTSNLNLDTNLEKFKKIEAQVERLEKENFKLVKQLECNKIVREANIKENLQQIAKLITEKNECKARAIQHKKRSEDATKTLEVIKAEHVKVAAELRKSLSDSRSTIRQLEQALDSQQRFNREMETKFNTERETYKELNEILQQRIKSLEERNEERDNKVKEGLAREVELTKRVNELESKLLQSQDSMANASNIKFAENLTNDYTNVCQQLKKVETANTKLESELKHYKGISQNVEYLREESASLKEQLLKTEEIKHSKFVLEIENGNLLAERDAWVRYLDEKPEYNQLSPADIVYNLTKQVEEGKFLNKKVELLEQMVEDQNKTVCYLEDHVFELKQTIAEKERDKSFNEEERNIYKQREESLKKHINILQNQLKLYDNEEMNLMEQTYDEKKVARIAELESLLHEFESQKVQVPEVEKNTPVIVSNGPYDQITSGVKILDFLRDLYQQKERCLEDLKKAKAIAQETFSKTVEESESVTELKNEEEEESNKENIPVEGRYLSLIDNPASNVFAVRQDTLDRLRCEVEELRKSKLNEITDITVINYQYEIEDLKNENDALQRRLDRTLQNFKNVLQEHKDYVQHILGYKITIRSDRISRLDPPFVNDGDLYFLVKDNDDESNEPLFRMCGANKDFYLQELGDIYELYIVGERNTWAFLYAAALHINAQNNSNAREQEEEEEEDRLEQEIEGYVRENEQDDDMAEIPEEGYDQVMNGTNEEVLGDDVIELPEEEEIDDATENNVNGDIIVDESENYVNGDVMDNEMEEEYEEDEEEEYEEEEFDDDINEYEETQAFDDDEDDYNDENDENTNDQNVIELDDDDDDGDENEL